MANINSNPSDPFAKGGIMKNPFSKETIFA
jgi:hypothetical protein